MKLRLLIVAVSMSLTVPSLAQSTNYCVGIRGNGENVSAHWPALGRLAEENGLPSATAGGSSATVSMFFLESLALNPALSSIEDKNLKNKAYGMMLKSMPAYVNNLLELENVLSAYQFVQQMGASNSKLKDGFWGAIAAMQDMKKTKENMKLIENAFQKFMPLVNPEILEGLFPELKSPVQSTRKFNFYKSQILNALKVFGKFDARADDNLFVRPGLVDFRYFAVWLGTIADFYAGNIPQDLQPKMNKFITSCAADSYRLPWSDPSFKACRDQFDELVKSYAAQPMDKFQHKRLFQKVGAKLPSYATTSIVRGAAIKRYQDMQEQFQKGNAAHDYQSFKIDFENELSYGYWVPSSKAAKNLEVGLKKFNGDLKSSKFMSLGTGNWFQVLSTSPAEPGLASFQKIPTSEVTWKGVEAELAKGISDRWKNPGYSYRSELSAGGWSDLHPTMVLKASGCKQVVYLTRQNGDSVFGQQVFIRLTGLKEEIKFWTQLGEIDPSKIEGVVGTNRLGWQMNGVSGEGSSWDRISNLGNKTSSFNNSITAADAVYCTDWDRFDVFKGENAAMVEEAYRSPVFLKRSGNPKLQVNLSPKTFDKINDFPGCLTPKERE